MTKLINEANYRHHIVWIYSSTYSKGREKSLLYIHQKPQNMCFSASVSFGASAVIGSVGVKALTQAKTTPQKIFALTPILFATQQLSEGFIWMSLQNPSLQFRDMFLPGLTVMFLIFAWLIWPVFIPYFMMRLEEEKNRKIWLKGIFSIGLTVSIIFLLILFTYDVQPRIDARHIVFDRTGTVPFVNVLGSFYFMALIFPFFISSNHKMRILGIINIFSFLIARFMFETYLISVWCFFAAISSVIVLYLIKDMQGEKIRLFSNIHIPTH